MIATRTIPAIHHAALDELLDPEDDASVVAVVDDVALGPSLTGAEHLHLLGLSLKHI
jgi:hypothetical protein